MVNNCRTLVCFGTRSDRAWREMTDSLGMDGCPRSKVRNGALVQIDGEETIVERLD